MTKSRYYDISAHYTLNGLKIISTSTINPTLDRSPNVYLRGGQEYFDSVSLYIYFIALVVNDPEISNALPAETETSSAYMCECSDKDYCIST